MAREIPVTVTVIKDWRGHKKGNRVEIVDYGDLAFVESRSDVFSFNGAPAASAEEIVETVVAPRRKRKAKSEEAPEET